MPRASKNDLPIATEMEGFESRQTEWGGFTAAFETIAGGLDATEFFSSLPGGMCQSPHWGYVVKGKVRVKYADHEEAFSAGDAYYMPPGHIPVVEEDSLIVEFSPLGEYQETLSTLEGSPRAVRNRRENELAPVAGAGASGGEGGSRGDVLGHQRAHSRAMRTDGGRPRSPT